MSRCSLGQLDKSNRPDTSRFMGREIPDYLQAARPMTALPPALADAVSEACAGISHNLNGQRLGRKGRLTRERILAAAIEMLDSSSDEPFTLGNVAKRAGLGLTSLYNYFTDLTELMLAVLDPVMATAEDAYLAILRERWPDDELFDRCYAFSRGYHDFWLKHSRLLHFRNALADNRDERMFLHRIQSTRPIIELLILQMASEVVPGTQASAMATMVMIGLERSVTIVTDQVTRDLARIPRDIHEDRFLVPAARLMEFIIRDARSSQEAD